MGRAQEILMPQMLFREKMAAFIQFISEMLANGRPSAAESAIFSSLDLQNDPEIKKIRAEAQGKMTHLLLELIQEGKQQSQVNPDLSDEALGMYFGVFMDMFVNPQLQRRSAQNPGLVQELGNLMMFGLSGEQK
jgi:hypothetical protein